jgi:hypothetical protein
MNMYAEMVVAASEIVMQNRGREYRDDSPTCVLFTFNKKLKFPKGFPKPNVYSREGDTVTYRLNACSLLDWLYDNKHSTYNVAMLVKQTKSFQYFEKSIDRMFEL